MNKKAYPLLSLLILSSCANTTLNLVVNIPTSNALQHLDEDIVKRTVAPTLESLDDYFQAPENKDCVVSPASYLLAVSGLSAVSEGFDNSSFGLQTDASDDVKSLLEAWNFAYDASPSGSDYTYFRSAVLHQQVGPTYKFDEEARKQVSDKYIATMVSNLDNYSSDAQNFLNEQIDLSIPLPNSELMDDGVITYGAIKIKDYIPNGLYEEQKEFTSENITSMVNTYSFGYSFPQPVLYWVGETYQAFKMEMNYTSLLIILPNQGVSLESISVADTYSSFMAEANYVSAYGYIPFFHLVTSNADLTAYLQNKLTGQEMFFSKLLASDVYNDLQLISVMQNSDFEFNKYGVAGESVTAIEAGGSTGPLDGEPVNLEVNRPFYALSLKDNFPIFVNKVNRL
jgi:hypothetical protein